MKKLVVLITLLVAGAAPAGEEIVSNGRITVKNPAEPPEGIVTVELEKVWSLGGDEGEVLLGLPTGLGADDAGNVYVLDAQLGQVHVVAPDGTLLDTRMREGDGPGEMRHPSDLVVWPDGALGIVQEFPGQVVRVDATGLPVPTLHPGGPTSEGGWGVLMTGAPRGADGIVVCGQMTRQNEAGEREVRAYLAAFAADGAEEAVMFEETRPPRDRSQTPRERDMLKPYMMSWDTDRDGSLAMAVSWDRYQLFVFGSDGKLERIIEKEHEPWRRRDADVNFMKRLFGVPEGAPAPIDLDDHEPVISITMAGVQFVDGEIWVLPSRNLRKLPDGVLQRFDVFDRQGHFRRQVDVRCPGDPLNDRIAVLPGGRFVRQRRFVDCFVTSLGPGSLPADERGGEESTPAVICYRVAE